MSLVTALVAGGLVGVRHAFEADHLAAVTTLVDEAADRPGLVGASWGVGHSIPVVALGLLFSLLGIEVPASVTGLFEVAVGVVLVYLGVHMVVEAAGLAVERHGHTRDEGRDRSADACNAGTGHADRVRRGVHGHLRVGDSLLGRSHSHVDNGGFAVGVLHGVAGSGVLVVALVSTAPSIETALACLAAFSALTILTMSSVSATWGRALEAGMTRYLKGTAGIVGIAVGGLLVVETAITGGLL